jgi:hypothetical protein
MNTCHYDKESSFQSLLALFTVWVYLQLYYQGLPKCGGKDDNSAAQRNAVKTMLKRKYAELGPLSYAGI